MREVVHWCVTLLLGLVAGAACAASTALPQYRFDRQWPVVQRPSVTFSNPTAAAIDSDQTVIVSDLGNGRLIRMSPNGEILGSLVTIPDNPHSVIGAPSAIALDHDGNLWVVLVGKPFIQKYSTNFELLGTFGTPGTGAGEFSDNLFGIAIAPNGGDIYVVDAGNHRIDRFASDFSYRSSWPYFGTTQSHPYLGFQLRAIGLDVAPGGNVYVADVDANVVRVFGPDGAVVGAFQTLEGLGQPLGVAIDQDGFVYTSDFNLGTLSKATPDGTEVTHWGYLGLTEGIELWLSQLLDVDRQGNVWVPQGCCFGNFAIKHFRTNGDYVNEVRVGGSAPGVFQMPTQMTVDSAGNSYTVDLFNYRVQKFDPSGHFAANFVDGPSRAIGIWKNQFLLLAKVNGVEVYDLANNFLARWDSFDGVPYSPGYAQITTDAANEIWLTDDANNRVIKLDGDGNFLFSLNAPGLFDNPSAVAVDSQNRVYIADQWPSDLARIRTFANADGSYLATFPDQTIRGATQLWIDASDRIYATDRFRSTVRVYDTAGNVLGDLLDPGAAPGQAKQPAGIAIGPSGELLVSDAENSRVMRYLPGTVSQAGRAIIVAGGGPYDGNDLWDATQASANFAFRALAYQGYAKGAIRYISDNTTLDVDQNGIADDVVGPASNLNVEQAITGAFAAGADDLVVYLVDHGGTDTFRLSGTETLSATALAGWLGTWQSAHPGKRVTVIYDACHAGSFIDDLAAPNRLVIASADDAENAYFVSVGALSFSANFWSSVLAGVNVRDAYVFARDATHASFPTQTPQVDADGDGVANEPSDDAALALLSSTYIGTGKDLSSGRPTIGTITSPQTITGTISATITVGSVADADGVGRVWAIIRPPGYVVGSSGQAVTALPEVDLATTNNADYSTTWSGFTQTGTYQIAVYASDRLGNVSPPRATTVTVDSPLRRRAVVLAGGESTDLSFPTSLAMADFARLALTQQGYGADGVNCNNTTCDDILFLVNSGVLGVDQAATQSSLANALTVWAATGTSDVVLYVVGERNGSDIRLADGQSLSAAQLDGLLDQLQQTLPGTLTVVLDVDDAGSILRGLTPVAGRSRILLASTGVAGHAARQLGGALSFSKFFWGKVLDGGTGLSAFRTAVQGIAFAGMHQIPEIDDNDNLIPNEIIDGLRSSRYSIGRGILLAADAPRIGTISAPAVVASGGNYLLDAGDLSTTAHLQAVQMLVAYADGSSELRELSENPPGHYRWMLGPLASAQLPAEVAVYALDDAQNVSEPARTLVAATAAPIVSDVSVESTSTTNLVTRATIFTFGYAGTLTAEIAPSGGTFATLGSATLEARLTAQSMPFPASDVLCSSTYDVRIRAYTSAGAATVVKSFASAPCAPQIKETRVANVNAAAAGLRATALVYGRSLSGYFEWRAVGAPSFDATPSLPLAAVSGSQEMSANLANLQCDTNYEFRAVVGDGVAQLVVGPVVGIHTRDCADFLFAHDFE